MAKAFIRLADIVFWIGLLK
ncbi:Protein of unknown function [Bacillus thuringiensis]|uniref:Uncharacterized protein n=1 Tax=Bacillus thuringiensis TaxID=1428 RepID=A0A1C4G849_BACTU|nr:Protein of unknown function [Bacillus thuringiensis]